MREVFFAWRVSAYVHVGILGSLYVATLGFWRPFILPEALATAEGRAVIELNASMPSIKELDPDKETEAIVESAPREPVEPPLLEPTKFEMKKEPSEAPAPRVKEIPLVRETELAAIKAVDFPTEKPEKSETVESKVAPAVKPVPREPPKPLTEHAKELAEVTAPASVASRAVEGTDVDQPPQMLVNPTPQFPDGAVAAGRQGVVWLFVSVNAQGTVAAVRVQTSSGFADLDRSALNTIRRWRFKPAQRDGMNVGCDVQVPIRFTIR
jgi:protein TonB